MRFRGGSHNLAGRCHNRCPLGQRICQSCSADEVEDEHHVIFRCSAYEALQQAMHARLNWFACVGGMHRARRAGDEGMYVKVYEARHVACMVCV
jgi:hypothetical protein